MSIQSIFIIGATGHVGSTALKQIIQHDTDDGRRHQNASRIVGIANSNYFVFDPNGIKFSQPLLMEDGRKYISNYLKEKGKLYHDLDELLINEDITSSNIVDEIVYVDATSGKKDLEKFHCDVIKKTRNKLVTANKNPLALSDFSVFKELTRDRTRYAFSTTVMAGNHTNIEFSNLYDLSERVLSVEGCLSGSINFLCHVVSAGNKNFNEALEEAVKNGYTETNPCVDLSGEDVARKLIIIARTLNYDVSIHDVNLKPVVPTEEISNSSIEDVLSEISKRTSKVESLFSEAKNNNKVLRYVASLTSQDNDSHPILKVELKPLAADSHLSALSGTANKVCIVTETYTEDNPYIIQTPGAGPAASALGIRRDLLYLLPSRVSGNYRV